jgi:hypothetical protein
VTSRIDIGNRPAISLSAPFSPQNRKLSRLHSRVRVFQSNAPKRFSSDSATRPPGGIVPGFRTIILLVSIGLLTADACAAPLSGPVPLPDSGQQSKEKKSAEPKRRNRGNPSLYQTAPVRHSDDRDDVAARPVRGETGHRPCAQGAPGRSDRRRGHHFRSHRAQTKTARASSRVMPRSSTPIRVGPASRRCGGEPRQ